MDNNRDLMDLILLGTTYNEAVYNEIRDFVLSLCLTADMTDALLDAIYEVLLGNKEG